MTFDDEPPEINAKRNIWCTRCGENWDLCKCLSFSKNQKLRYSRKMCEHKILDGNAKYAWCHNPNCFSDMTDTDKGKKTIQMMIKQNKDYEVEIYNDTPPPSGNTKYFRRVRCSCSYFLTNYTFQDLRNRSLARAFSGFLICLYDLIKV